MDHWDDWSDLEYRNSYRDQVTENYWIMDEAVRHVRLWPWPGSPRVSHDGHYVLVIWPEKDLPIFEDFILKMFPDQVMISRGNFDYMAAWLETAYRVLPITNMDRSRFYRERHQ